MNDQIAEAIAVELRAAGKDVTADDVKHVHKYGWIADGIVGPEHDEYLTNAIQDALDERGEEQS